MPFTVAQGHGDEAQLGVLVGEGPLEHAGASCKVVQVPAHRASEAGQSGLRAGHVAHRREGDLQVQREATAALAAIDPTSWLVTLAPSNTTELTTYHNVPATYPPAPPYTHCGCVVLFAALKDALGCGLGR